MGTGKIAAQVAHAAVMGAEKVKTSRRDWFNAWFAAGQAKVVVKVKNIEELMAVRKRREELYFPVILVTVSGLTHIPSGALTCVGIGPAPSALIYTVTLELKLL